MSTNPVDVVAAAIRESCGGQPPAALAVPLADVAVRALADDRIVDHLTEALYRRGWGAIGDGGMCDMVRDAMRELAGA